MKDRRGRPFNKRPEGLLLVALAVALFHEHRVVPNYRSESVIYLEGTAPVFFT